VHCENKFCIYWAKDECSLDEISLDICGCCENCIYPHIDDEILEPFRKQLLEQLKD